MRIVGWSMFWGIGLGCNVLKTTIQYDGKTSISKFYLITIGCFTISLGDI